MYLLLIALLANTPAHADPADDQIAKLEQVVVQQNNRIVALEELLGVELEASSQIEELDDPLSEKEKLFNALFDAAFNPEYETKIAELERKLGELQKQMEELHLKPPRRSKRQR